MSARTTILFLYIALMVALIVGVDVAFLRHQFGKRLIVNIAIVVAFGVFYMSFLRRR